MTEKGTNNTKLRVFDTDGKSRRILTLFKRITPPTTLNSKRAPDHSPMILAGRYWTPCHSSFHLCPVQETLRLCGYLRRVSWPSEGGTRLEGENLVMTIIYQSMFMSSEPRFRRKVTRGWKKITEGLFTVLPPLCKLFYDYTLILIWWLFRFDLRSHQGNELVTSRTEGCALTNRNNPWTLLWQTTVNLCVPKCK